MGPNSRSSNVGSSNSLKRRIFALRAFPTPLCKRCGLFKSVRTGQAAPTCSIDTGHGRMDQFSFVEVHQCGHLKELVQPRCDNNCRAPMKLFNTRELKTANWYWSCSRCRTRVNRPISNFCSTCSDRQSRVQVLRIPQTTAYYPHQITVLNPPNRETYTALANEYVHSAAVAQAIGVLPTGMAGLATAGGSGNDYVAEVERMRATLGWSEDNPFYLGALEDARQRAGSMPAWREAVDELGLTPETIEILGEECLQLSLVQDAKALSVDGLMADARGNALEPLYETYRTEFARYGLEDITLLRQLPVAYIVAGYSRVSPRARISNRQGREVVARFKFFPPGNDGKFRMYGVRTETEGLLFRIDPLQIVRWLVDSRIIDDPGVTSADQARRWIFSVTEPIIDNFVPPENRISKAILGLTHSFAHRAMKALAARCGLDVDSLAEYLFPSNCAFLVYANTRSEFILGGLEHVYRYDLLDALAELDAESRCVFDPPCRRHFGGACAACLHVSEVACQRFNTVLDRNLMFGSLPLIQDGQADTEAVIWRPFWNS